MADRDIRGFLRDILAVVDKHGYRKSLKRKRENLAFGFEVHPDGIRAAQISYQYCPLYQSDGQQIWAVIEPLNGTNPQN